MTTENFMIILEMMGNFSIISNGNKCTSWLKIYEDIGCQDDIENPVIQKAQSLQPEFI